MNNINCEYNLFCEYNIICYISGIQLDEASSPHAFAGDHVILNITGVEMNNISIGKIFS